MGKLEKRRMKRQRLGDRLRDFHAALLTGFALSAEDLLHRVEHSLMNCPACGDEMVRSICIVTMNPRDPDYYFGCAKCGVSCFPESRTSTSAYARM